jgi:hypothetical protein
MHVYHSPSRRMAQVQAYEHESLNFCWNHLTGVSTQDSDNVLSHRFTPWTILLIDISDDITRFRVWNSWPISVRVLNPEVVKLFDKTVSRLTIATGQIWAHLARSKIILWGSDHSGSQAVLSNRKALEPDYFVSESGERYWLVVVSTEYWRMLIKNFTGSNISSLSKSLSFRFQKQPPWITANAIELILLP